MGVQGDQWSTGEGGTSQAMEGRMGKLTLGEKAERVFDLLMGMRSVRVATLLAARGFERDDVEQGWDRLRAMARTRFDASALKGADPGIVAELARWEHVWFPVVKTALELRYPAIAEDMFWNLSETEGPSVILSVSTLLQRVTALSAAMDQESQDAWALLNRRGLTSRMLERIQTLLASALLPPNGEPIDLEAHRKRIDRAETDLWNWYLQWSRIARELVTDRALLRSMGLLKPQSTPSLAEEAEAEVEASSPTNPRPDSLSPPLTFAETTQAS